MFDRDSIPELVTAEWVSMTAGVTVEDVRKMKLKPVGRRGDALFYDRSRVEELVAKRKAKGADDVAA